MQGKAKIIQAVIMAGIMAFLMTAVITFTNLGLPGDFLWRWMVAFVVAWPLAAIAALIAIPIAQRLTRRIVVALEGRS